MKDFFGRDLLIGDYCAFVGAESGSLKVVKIEKFANGRIGFYSIVDWLIGGRVKTDRMGFTPYGERLIICNDLISQEDKDILDK